MAISEPRISRQNGDLYSDEFRDVYFSREDGVEESRYVFLAGNNLEERWSRKNESGGENAGFTILETGFGTGLNFILAGAAFLDSNSAAKTLHYVSIEKFPLKKEDLLESLGKSFQNLKAILKSAHHARMVDSLAGVYPLRTTGFHRIVLENGRISLTLAFMDVGKALAQIQTESGVDAFFLDGFNPATNSEMWKPENFRELFRLAAPGATLATFTAAGHVRRGLQEAGFEVKKIQGYGRKREMITAIAAKGKTHEKNYSSQSSGKPWFFPGHLPSEIAHKKKERLKVAIIGGGVAGCTLAEAFSRRNCDVELIERHDDICAEASGNPLGIFFPVVHRRPTFADRFSLAAYLYMLRHLDRLRAAGLEQSIGGRQNGLLQMLDARDKADRFGEYAKLHGSLDCFFEIDPDRFDFEELSSVKSGKSGGIFFPAAGFLSPKGLSGANLALASSRNNIRNSVDGQVSLSLITSCHITSIEQINNQWIIRGTIRNGESAAGNDEDKSSNMEFASHADVVVLANSGGLKKFSQTQNLPLHIIRGQLIYTEFGETEPLNLPFPVSGAEYIIEGNGKVIIGATHDISENVAADDAQSARLLEQGLSLFDESDPAGSQIREKLRDAFEKSMKARVSFRSAAVDHFPLAGPVADEVAYGKIFAELAHGDAHFLRRRDRGDDLPLTQAWHRNLYCLAGLGSRGILYSHLGAEIVAAQACGEPLPVESDLSEALSPARFLYRKIRRRNPGQIL